jgi:hypothetical protein
MDPAQDWCLQCGAGAPASLDARNPSWHSAATILGACAILALAAAAAGYAALSKGSHRSTPAPATLAFTPATSTVTPVTPPAGTPLNPNTSRSSRTPKSALPLGIVKPPKIPLTAITPKASPTTTIPSKPAAKTTTPATGTTPSGSSGAESSTGENQPSEGKNQPSEGKNQPSAILLDTNAAATYNPYGYPPSDFGDPSLAIDGDPSTGWTARLQAAVAPKMAEGIVIDLKTARRLSALELITSTPGMTVQVYGAATATLPTSILEPSWVKLTPSMLEKKRHLRIKLRHPTRAFRFVTLWISRAPAASIGTPQAPGRVSVNEIELFPAT